MTKKQPDREAVQAAITTRSQRPLRTWGTLTKQLEAPKEEFPADRRVAFMLIEIVHRLLIAPKETAR